MNLPALRVGIYLLLSVAAVAVLAGGVALSRRADLVHEREHAAWGASAG